MIRRRWTIYIFVSFSQSLLQGAINLTHHNEISMEKHQQMVAKSSLAVNLLQLKVANKTTVDLFEF